MIHEQRVKLMSRLAAYEETEGKKNVEIGSYFRSDYIALQILKTLIYATLSFGLVLALVLLYDSEMFINEIYKLDILAYVKQIIFYYIGFTGVYTLISYAIYALRYRKAKKRLKVYFNNLRRLQILYQRERKDKTRS